MNFWRALFTKKLEEYLNERKKKREEYVKCKEQEGIEQKEAYEKDLKENPCKYLPHAWEVIRVDNVEFTGQSWGRPISGWGQKKVSGCRKCNGVKFRMLNPNSTQIEWEYDVAMWEYKNVIDDWMKKK
jgi:hypothetical protein